MSTYVFFNVSAYGHINPTLPIVRELGRRGHKVYYFVGEGFADDQACYIQYKEHNP